MGLGRRSQKGKITGSLFMQHTPSRFLQKVAGMLDATKHRASAPAEVSRFCALDTAARKLHHAHPAFTRFMVAHPRISRFLAEHPKTSRFLFNVAHHIPVIEHYVPIAPHISSAFVHRAKPRKVHLPRFF